MNPRQTETPAPRIFISVAEDSADLYAGRLIHAIRRRMPDFRFFGLTGPHTRDAGCETFHDLSAKSSMLLGTLRRIPGAILMIRRLKRELRTHPPAAAVLVDSPTLNLRLAKICKLLQIPVLYYVAPQTWAWAEGRVHKMRRCIDRLAVILPFEQDHFLKHGIPARFVGHPLFEHLEQTRPDEYRIAELRRRGHPIVALLPGSRRQVIHEVFPGQLEIAARITSRFPDAFFLVVAAHAQAEDLARILAGQLVRSGLKLSLDRFIFDCRRHDAMLLAADLALVASGTATLEVAYRATPMIVMYNHGRLLYPVAKTVLRLLGKPFLTTKYLSLPNILAGRELVPEFMPSYSSVDPIAAKAIELLEDPAARQAQEQQLAELVAPLVRTDVSDTVAQMLMELLPSADKAQ